MPAPNFILWATNNIFCYRISKHFPKETMSVQYLCDAVVLLVSIFCWTTSEKSVFHCSTYSVIHWYEALSISGITIKSWINHTALFSSKSTCASSVIYYINGVRVTSSEFYLEVVVEQNFIHVILKSNRKQVVKI